MWNYKPSWRIEHGINHKTAKKQQGYLLLEVILALPLLAFLAGALLSIFWVGLQLFQQQTSKAEAQYFGRAALYALDMDIKQGKSLAVLPGNILEIQCIDNRILVYTVENHQVYRKVYQQQANSRVFVNQNPLSEKTEKLEFQLLLPDLVIIYLETGDKDNPFRLKTASRITT